MKTHMAPVLREAARRIETGEVRYKWNLGDDCNCGIVAQVALSMDSGRLYRERCKDWQSPSWSAASRRVCPQTGIPFHKVIKTLMSIGMEVEDFVQLEYLSNQTICKRAGIDSSFYQFSHSVSRYLRVWADMLDEQAAREAETVASAPASDVAMTSTPILSTEKAIR